MAHYPKTFLNTFSTCYDKKWTMIDEFYALDETWMTVDELKNKK